MKIAGDEMDIGIIGCGQIGQALVDMICQKYNLSYYNREDQSPKLHLADFDFSSNFYTNLWDGAINRFDITNKKHLNKFVKKLDICINAGPHFLNTLIIDACIEHDVTYFDFSEDVESLNYIKEQIVLNNLKDKKMKFIPSCGLAPGLINILAGHYIKGFEEVNDVKIRVGSLPKNPTNRMKYNLMWSTDGLINEYLNDCQIIQNGKKVMMPSLDGYEKLLINGIEYEAFRTSGGAGTLCDTYENKVKNLDYKTIRYPGHMDYMKFLFDDLNFRNKRADLVKIFNENIPKTNEDLVIIFCSVLGKIRKNHHEHHIHYNELIPMEKTFTNLVYGNEKHTAIQITTAGSAFAVLNFYINSIKQHRDYADYNCFDNNILIKQEDIPLHLFNKYGLYNLTNYTKAS